jgi:hypothetical protein
MNVTFVHADRPEEFNSGNWRSFIPAEAFNRTRRHKALLLGIQDFCTHPPVAEYHCKDADAIVLQRGAMPAAWEAVAYWQQRGKIVISDIDDGYPQLGPEHPAFNFWHRGLTRGPNGQPAQMPRPAILDMAEGLTRVNGLTAPNRLILDDWQTQVGVRGAFVPNYPDLRVYQAKRTRSPKDDGTTWVAWGGSAGHLASFTDSGILYALARVLSRRPATRMIYCGSDLRAIDAVPLKEGQKQHFNWRPYPEWPALLANFDIGLIPVAGAFDARRSWLKPLEHSLMGIPWIASKSPAYEGLEEYGVFVDNTPDAWAAALADLLDHGPDETKLRRARKWALAQDIDNHVDEMANIYRSFGK